MMGKWRDFVEDILPWFDPIKARVHDRRTEAIRWRSISARIRAERIIADYEQADEAARDEAQKMIDELRRETKP